MKEPDHHKDIAIAYTLHRTDGKPDWSKSVNVRMYRCVNPFSFISPRWKVLKTKPEESSFPSLEEAVMYFSMKDIKLYKIREGSDLTDLELKDSIWRGGFKDFAHVTRTMRKLEKIRVLS